MSTPFRQYTTCFFLAAMMLAGCAQKDSSVGSDLAPGLNDIFPEEVVLDPTESAFYNILATTGDSDYLYAGRAQGYESHLLLKFNPHTSLPDSYAVDSLAVKLTLDSVIVPDLNLNPMEIDVSFINEEQTWAEIGVTWDSLDAAQLPEPFADFEVPAASIGYTSFGFTPYPTDSTKRDSLLRAWELAGAGGKTLHYNNGLYLKSGKIEDHLIRFCSAEHDSISKRPQLEIYLTVFDTTGGVDSTWLDTINLYAGGDAFIVQDTEILDPSYLYLGNAVAYRSILQFDLQDIFPTYGVGVHRAEVLLHADTMSESNLGQITGTYHFEMSDSSWLQDPENAAFLFGAFPIYGEYDPEEAVLSLNLTDMVYEWIRNPETNFGFLVRTVAPLADISRTVFYGIDYPDTLLRPRLRITYLENNP